MIFMYGNCYNDFNCDLFDLANVMINEIKGQSSYQNEYDYSDNYKKCHNIKKKKKNKKHKKKNDNITIINNYYNYNNLKEVIILD